MSSSTAATYPRGGLLLRTFLTVRGTLAQGILRLLGWRFHTTCEFDLTRGDLHRFPPKWIVFGEPHTHVLDFLFMLLFFWSYRLPHVHVAIRKRYFYPGLGWFMRWRGAIAVDPNRSNGLVEQLVETMKRADAMILHIPPSGTRRRTDRWRSGFYHIATQAQVPVFMAYLDASTKTYGYAAPFELTGDVKADMDVIRAFYADKRGFVPEKESTIILREETQSP